MEEDGEGDVAQGDRWRGQHGGQVGAESGERAKGYGKGMTTRSSEGRTMRRGRGQLETG